MKQALSQIVTVLNARKYSFEDEKEKGRMVEGCKVDYVMDWDGDARQNFKGLDIMTATLDIADFDNLGPLPADCDVVFSVRAGRKGEPVLHVDECKWVQAFIPVQTASVSPNADKAK